MSWPLMHGASAQFDSQFNSMKIPQADFYADIKHYHNYKMEKE